MLNVIMLSAIMLNVIMLSVVMPNVIIGTVVVKLRDSQMFDHFDKFVDRLVISFIFAKVFNFRQSIGVLRGCSGSYLAIVVSILRSA